MKKEKSIVIMSKDIWSRAEPNEMEGISDHNRRELSAASQRTIS